MGKRNMSLEDLQTLSPEAQKQIHAQLKGQGSPLATGRAKPAAPQPEPEPTATDTPAPTIVYVQHTRPRRTLGQRLDRFTGGIKSFVRAIGRAIKRFVTWTLLIVGALVVLATIFCVIVALVVPA